MRTKVNGAAALFALGLGACSSGGDFQAMEADAGIDQVTSPESDAGRADAHGDGDKGRTTCGIDAPIVHGVRPDGRVDVSATEAWPGRPAEPPALTSAELLGSCAILAACFRLSGADAGTAAVDKQMADALRQCVDPKSHGNEERVIPELNQNERWSFNARTLLAKKGCGGLFLSTPRAPGIVCDEGGCRFDVARGSPSVKCTGEVATATLGSDSFTRDCSHAYSTCSESSPTGCNDRPPATCQSAGTDRCDGDVKLGCDHCGLVSFHDCGVMGGHCVETAAGASCVYPDAGECGPQDQACTGNVLTGCVAGRKVTVDCMELGLKGCSAGHCVAP